MDTLTTLTVNTGGRAELVDITAQVRQAVAGRDVREGVCHLFVPHTTAGITINEHTDPTVARDILAALEKLVPWTGDYHHGEGNSAAHIKAGLTGSGLTVPISGGRLVLGTWQGIFLCEFDGPRQRRVIVKIIAA
ncbi:secondary thiamine-phosphate synthase enzyme YjbQ [Desulfotomaculum copahuensis]|uniref:Secondary thiamine-phosphate synthase enzyme n=1 Tax=Desulfotomaculum copahuensis TaxID=1838280 RepID=A0A1B7LHC8_9FIRM|nr:secondary thiamine-phosphate synthase enzyme YjbQ [Desulfotomaculum copahuensis]OAT85528.1 hypothetical protein A6M21_06355 [Desulfotomaculum copahuensis]